MVSGPALKAPAINIQIELKATPQEDVMVKNTNPRVEIRIERPIPLQESFL